LKLRLQSDASRLWRYTALLVVFLMVAFSVVEVTHAHSATTPQGRSGACVICVSAHSNAPAASFQPSTVLLAIATIAVFYESSSIAVSPQFKLFIRPPPAA